MELKLRPHHLLCTQSYQGMGYDAAFQKHMDAVVHRLRTEARTPIRLVFTTDELCSHCPHRLGEDLCETNEKVKAFDAHTAECFHLKEKTYIYQELAGQIRQSLTEELFDHICGGCSWASVCRKVFIRKTISSEGTGGIS